MQRQTTLSIWCERIIEAGWLLCIALIPIYFNLFSARHFEPDKATTLRAIVLMMAATGLVMMLERLSANSGSSASSAGDQATGNPFAGLAQRFSNIPLAVPTLVYTLVFLFTTFTSVVPLTSFWGSYQRLQGTYTNLSYIMLFVLIVATLRRREQLERLITVALATCTVVAGYGVLQHQGLDPLPWRGDVITRVASTMGNSIFVASYMLMVLPLALYRFFGALHDAGSAAEVSNQRADLLWAFARVVLLFGTLALLLSMIKLGTAWWMLPGAVAVATPFWALLAPGSERSSNNRSLPVPIWPSIVFGAFTLLIIMTATLATGPGAPGAGGRAFVAEDWWIWLLVSVAAVVIYYGLALMLPEQPAAPSRLAYHLRALGAGLTALLFLAAIFFTQSRGPWIGTGFGLFVFFSLLLWYAARRARAGESIRLASRLRALLAAWVGITLAIGGFLIVFNISNAPIFEQLRQVPYVGRMGRLLEVDEGTGKVRRLIWVGDQFAGGAVALITSDPLRTIIGWGPESMFVAFNRFYPPSLANVESRGASPDRSHQAILDELVTKGILGLISYFFLLTSALMLCWRLIRRSQDWHWQLFFIACFSVIVGNFIDGLTGIPIVSTLTMFWVTLGIIVTGGMLAGHYRLGAMPGLADIARPDTAPDTPVPAVETPSPAAEKRKPTPAGGRAGGKRGTVARGAATARSATTTSSARRGGRPQTSPPALAFYGLLTILTLAGIWWFNLNPVYADMRFQEGQAYTEQPNAGLGGLIMGMDNYLATIRGNPREDFYYLNLGRVLMTLADELRSQGVPMGQPDPRANVDTLLRLENPTQVQTFVQGQTPLGMMSYAEAVLERARNLNSMNKDHYANLGRLNNFWYSWTQDPARLQDAVKWYEQVSMIAPQDVTLINERASVLAELANYSKTKGDQAAADQTFAQAQQLLERSRQLDARYTDTDVRLADLYRLQGRLAEATDLYISIIKRTPHQIDASVERIAASLAPQPELLRKLRDTYAAQAGNDALLHAIAGLLSIRVGDSEQALTSYQQAVAIQPNSLEYRRNYTLVLSDTKRYSQAVAEAKNALALIQGQQARQQEAAQLQALIELLERKAAGGQ